MKRKTNLEDKAVRPEGHQAGMDETMRMVKMRYPYVYTHKGKSYQPGEIVIVTVETAARLIKDGYADPLNR